MVDDDLASNNMDLYEDNDMDDKDAILFSSNVAGLSGSRQIKVKEEEDKKRSKENEK